MAGAALANWRPAAAPGVAPVVIPCPSASTLISVLRPTTGLAVWRRPARAGLRRGIAALLERAPFCVTAEGKPEIAARTLLRSLPVPARALGGDILLLGRLFTTLTPAGTIRLRLEHVSDNACRRHHVDAVALRLLCTYAGAGTEWIDMEGHDRRMPAFHVGVFKGSAYPDTASRVLHRSPAVEHLPPSRRSRLLLCIDEPGVF